MVDVGKEGLKALGKAKKMGSRLVFEYFLEEHRPQLIKEFQEVLNGITPEKMVEMVAAREFPHFAQKSLRDLHGYEDYIEHITAKRLFEALAEARLDLAQAIWDVGDDGVRYMREFRRHYLDRIINAGDHEAEQSSPESAGDVVVLECDICNKSWPAQRNELPEVIECPFCHESAPG
ncbi:hypothetical protein LCGC14_1494500 [marine sediment metagenome]|uniref:Uncharacterized protein n=1 Tax=marine sediment metagenome TaxID=412755 RepID=A0A0F9JRQ2_9ZZZZ